MPTNRKRIVRGRVVYMLTLAELTINEQICFWRCWYPSISVRTRWKTWAEYFSDYEAVKAELLVDPIFRRVYGPGFVPFADRVRVMLSPGQVYDGHAHLALWHSHAFTPGDNHRHEDDDDGRDRGDDVPPGRVREVAVV